VNGDGYADFIVGAWASAGGDAGRAYVYFGGPGANDLPDLTLQGEYGGDNFGTSVASAGDVNGDGFGDLIIGAWRYLGGAAQTGRAYVFYGGPGIDAIPDRVFSGQNSDDRFGISVSSAGDLNADGFADVIIGASGNDAGGIDAGRAYICFGRSTPNAVAVPAPVAPDLMLTGAAAGDGFGYAVSCPGDLNADGFPDIAVGAYASGGIGRAYVYYGGPGLDTVADRVFMGEAAGDDFGLALAPAGDMNGDGNVDLVVAAVRNDAAGVDAGRAYVFYGGPGLDTVADLTFTGAAAGDNFGVSVSSGDMNGDGINDLIAGAWLNDARGLNTGRAYVYYGGPGADAAADITLTGEVGEDRFGSSVAGLGDVNADGTADLIVGAYFNDFGGIDAGRAYVVTREVNRPPALAAPGSVFGAEGVFISLQVAATDPDGDHVTLGVINRPVGSLFVDLGNNSGTFSWTPGFAEAGTYIVTFTGRDDQGADAIPRDLTIVVDNVNRGPTAVPGGPYTGVVNVAVTFNGTGSADPDGNALSYLWDFGDLTTGSGITLAHSYAAGGTFTVVLTVGDGQLTNSASTISTIQDVFPARAFTTSSNGTIRLGSGKATWCVVIEPVSSSFIVTSVIPSTVAMKYGTAQIFAQGGKGSSIEDKDANGVQDMAVCFSKTDLRTLFAGLSKGMHTATATLEGDLSTGGKFQTPLTVDVVSNGGSLATLLSPNPLNPTANLTVSTSVPGNLAVTVFDLQGRLVRTIERGAYYGAGYHDFQVDGRDEQGERLSSGIYYYRVETAEGTETGQFVIMK